MMRLHVYNTRSRSKEAFAPRDAPQVTMYVCGPTVYDVPHIGHARSAYIFDVIRRYLERTYTVRFVRNVTDVDDKIIERAAAEGCSAQEVAGQYLAAYHEAMASLGIRPPDDEPYATSHIDAMIELTSKLLVREMAYEVDGNVYFDVRKFSPYGALSHQQLDAMQTSGRVVQEDGKRAPLDFALWKSTKSVPSWPSPWGTGRPGWHLECSAMSMHCLGTECIDIHGGGLDLIFPHHENEIAQSEGATGKEPFAKYWLHHGLLTINGQKMSKSAGNFVTVADAVAAHGSRALKLLFLSAHYRSPIDYSQIQIDEAAKMAERFDIAFQRLDSVTQQGAEGADAVASLQQRFTAALDDDFNTPAALACLFELVTWMHKQCDAGVAFPVPAVQQLLLDAGGLFGLFNEPEHLADRTIDVQVATRDTARAAKDFTTADTIRDALLAEGVVVEDTPQGTIWRRKR